MYQELFQALRIQQGRKQTTPPPQGVCVQTQGHPSIQGTSKAGRLVGAVSNGVGEEVSLKGYH